MQPKSWATFLNTISNRIEQLNYKKCDVPFFRGQSNKENTYKLTPKIFRNPFLEIYKNREYFEYDLYFDFVTKGGIHVDKNSTWHNLFIMQHYGLPTRLLDWTDNFAIALFFALRDYDETKCRPEIIILNPFELNKASFPIGELINPELTKDFPRYLDLIDKDVINPNVKKYRKRYPIALYPYRFNDRLAAQGGYFTFHGADYRGIDEFIPSVIDRYEIPKKLVRDAMQFLELAGINEYNIYTDLDSLSRHLTDHFKNKYARPSSPLPSQTRELLVKRKTHKGF